MKIDLSLDLALLDVTEWDLRVWLAVLLIGQGFALLVWVRHQMKQDSPVERLARGRHFGV